MVMESSRVPFLQAPPPRANESYRTLPQARHGYSRKAHDCARLTTNEQESEQLLVQPLTQFVQIRHEPDLIAAVRFINEIPQRRALGHML